MKTAIFILLTLAPCFAAKADEPTIASPDKRYLLTLRHSKPESIYPVIVLHDARTNLDTEIFDCDSVGQGTTSLQALWSPDSHSVALTVAVGPSTTEVEVYHIADGRAAEVELLPLPKAIDKKKYSFRGGPFADSWQNNRILWIGDSSKSRLFRYHFTKDGKFRADTFKDYYPPD